MSAASGHSLCSQDRQRCAMTRKSVPRGDDGELGGGGGGRAKAGRGQLQQEGRGLRIHLTR